jgi:hypothetical protein
MAKRWCRLAAFQLAALMLPGALCAAAIRISDPAVFVREVYRQSAASDKSGDDYMPPEDVFTPRLSALLAEEKRWANGEVGCLDFVFWVNGQDYALKDVHVTSRKVAAHPDRRLVIAAFINLGAPQQIHFDFRRIGGLWLLDDVRSLS